MLAQVQGGTELVKTATTHSWEAGAVAVILLVLMASIGYLMRALWNVNQRLAERVTNLETELTGKLMTIVENTTAAVVANTQMLERTSLAIDKLELAVESSSRIQQGILARIETSPCLMANFLSHETKETLQQAQQAAQKAAYEANHEK